LGGYNGKGEGFGVFGFLAAGAAPGVGLFAGFVVASAAFARVVGLAEELGRITVRASLDPALKSAGETVGPVSSSWAGVVGAAAGPAGGPAPGAAPAAGGSGASDGSGGRSRAKSAPKGAEAARRASPVNKDAFELNKPSLIPPKVGAESSICE